MNGFGFLENINKLIEATNESANKELVDMNPLTEEDENEIDNVSVPEIGTDEYIPTEKKSGSAGNVPDQSINNEGDPQFGCADDGIEEADPQLDGIGGSMKQSMGGLNESTDDDTDGDIDSEIEGDLEAANIDGTTGDVDNVEDTDIINEANEGAIVDEAPMKDASTRTSENVIEKAKDIFKEMYGSSYEKRATEKDYDLDATTPTVTTKEPVNFFRVKKGW